MRFFLQKLVFVTASDNSVKGSKYMCNGNCYNRSFGSRVEIEQEKHKDGK